jgi:pyruvate formate lyase activating enzyme
MSEGLIFDVKKYALHDGPGIRTTVFFKGCPLRCAWCHNPEGQAAGPELMVKTDRCLDGCRACVESCEAGAVTRTGKRLEIDRGLCTGCGACVEACPSRAVELAGRRWSVPRLMDEILRDSVFHETSGGGVTFSGGEPLLQPDFLEEALAECRRKEIHTAVDTCGCAAPEILDRFLGRTDLFLYDFKVLDEARHREWTGVSNRVILENLSRLVRSGQEVIVRIPLVKGVIDSPADVGAAAEYLRALGRVRRIDLLPYHGLARDKYRRLGRTRTRRLAAPARPDLERIKATLEGYDFQITLGESR